VNLRHARLWVKRAKGSLDTEQPLAFSSVFFLVLPLLHRAACSADEGLLDTDKNGVLDIEEVETAASKLFSGLDRDKRIRLMLPSSRGGLMLRPLGTAIPIMTGRSTKLNMPMPSR